MEHSLVYFFLFTLPASRHSVFTVTNNQRNVNQSARHATPMQCIPCSELVQLRKRTKMPTTLISLASPDKGLQFYEFLSTHLLYVTWPLLTENGPSPVERASENVILRRTKTKKMFSDGCKLRSEGTIWATVNQFYKPLQFKGKQGVGYVVGEQYTST